MNFQASPLRVASICLLLGACAAERPTDGGLNGADAGTDAGGVMAARVGESCRLSSDCQSYPGGAWCLSEAQAARLGLEAPDGYCTSPSCDELSPATTCGLGTVCGNLGGTTNGSFCEAACSVTTDCRTGYVCIDSGCEPKNTNGRDGGPSDAGSQDAGAFDAGAPDAGPCEGPCEIEAAFTSTQNEPPRFPFDLFGNSVFAGTAVSADLNGTYSDYQVPSCSGLTCCSFQYFGYSVTREAAVAGSSYVIRIRGGTKGPAYSTGYIQLQSPWIITGTSGSIGEGSSGVSISSDHTRIDFTTGLSSSVCNCSDCARADYAVFVER